MSELNVAGRNKLKNDIVSLNTELAVVQKSAKEAGRSFNNFVQE
jgi:hypothetical protein